MERLSLVKGALLSLQRYSWEQGTCAQAFFEAGDDLTAYQLVMASVLRTGADGRPAQIGSDGSGTDCCSLGETLLYFAEKTGNPTLQEAKEKLLDWALSQAPRNENGVPYHVLSAPQFWADSVYMLPPFLAAAGRYSECLQALEAYLQSLFDPDSGLYRHIVNAASGEAVDPSLWGVGNGWILAGLARVIDLLPDTYAKEREKLCHTARALLRTVLKYMREDGLFPNILDREESFAEVNLSQMAAYTIYRGLHSGWLSREFLAAAERLVKAAEGCVDTLGFVSPVCGMPRFDAPGVAPEGQAFFILMETAREQFERSDVVPQKD